MKKLQRFISFICLIIVLLACSLLPSPTEPQSEIPTEIPLLIAEDETSAAEEADDVVSTAVEVEESKGDQTKTDGGDTDASEMVSEADEEESAEPTPQVNTAALVLADPAEMGVDVTLAVDITNPLHRISPMVYGVNFGEEDFILDANIPVRRWGGNATTRYNWETDVSNRASDWFYLNVPNELDDPSTLPFGSGADHFVGFNEDNSIESMKTISMIGWTPAGRERSCSFSVEKYGAQQYEEPYGAGCGNGVYQDGTLIVDNDPFDVHEEIGPEYAQEWMDHLSGQFGTAAEGGVQFYSLDNEPMLWHHTHRDVHPGHVSYDELRDLTYEYAAAIKETDPDALTFGPVLWGWTAYTYSALDSAEGGSWWQDPPDYRAHDSIPLAEWYLQEMASYEALNGVRLLDYFDLHYYPQSPGVALSDMVDEDTQALRLRSTRSLWDRTYVDESWIDEPIRLIPLMRDWVNQHYPGTKTALTEYNWGAVRHINGAITQADILGIFGRERLDFATMWDPPTADQPTAFAFRMYRNYDGANSTFGDISIPALTSDTDRLAVYGAIHESDGTVTIMVVNKGMEDISSAINLPLAGERTAEVYRYSEANLDEIEQLDPQEIDDGFTTTFPTNSITLYVLR